MRTAVRRRLHPGKTEGELTQRGGRWQRVRGRIMEAAGQNNAIPRQCVATSTADKTGADPTAHADSRVSPTSAAAPSTFS